MTVVMTMVLLKIMEAVFYPVVNMKMVGGIDWQKSNSNNKNNTKNEFHSLNNFWNDNGSS